MQIDRALNIVISVDSDKAGPIHVHSMPVGREVFERYFLVLSKVYSSFDREQIWSSAPRISALLLKSVSMATASPEDPRQNAWEGMAGVENGLLAEIRRLTNVVLPGAQGWTTMPFVDAVRTGIIDAEDASDIESLLIFFTCLSAAPLTRHARRDMTQRMASSLDVRTVSLSVSEFCASLPISTETANSGATVPT